MIRVRQIKVPLDEVEFLKKYVAKKLKIIEEDILDLKIVKESIDARKKTNIFLIYEVDVTLEKEKRIRFSEDVFETPNEEFKFEITGEEKLQKRPIIIGAGPAGLFCAYILASNGYNPLVIERGSNIDDRTKQVLDFWENGKLNLNSNVSFGEGGAGTFSDGKLNTLVKDKEFIGKKVFEIFVECGAPKEIMYKNKPHIGTDVLRSVIKNMRNKIILMGGEFKFNTCLTNINYVDNKIISIELNEKEIIDTDILVLATGHSARDTFLMLYNNKLNMQAKPFAVGVRIEHPQKDINISQYGFEDHPYLKNADYKLTYTTKSGRGVYSFCMCPGGYVVNASTEDNRLCINGMSYHDRNSKNANSALVVTVGPSDFGNNVLDGIEFQRKLEEKAYKLGKGFIPCQLYKDYKNNIVSTNFYFESLTKGKSNFANLNELFPNYINESLKEAIMEFGKKIKNFDRDDAILLGVESRTSSPIRIIRNEDGVSNILGIYPCGEGAGYAGGITTSAMDGIKTALYIAKKYKP